VFLLYVFFLLVISVKWKHYWLNISKVRKSEISSFQQILTDIIYYQIYYKSKKWIWFLIWSRPYWYIHLIRVELLITNDNCNILDSNQKYEILPIFAEISKIGGLGGHLNILQNFLKFFAKVFSPKGTPTTLRSTTFQKSVFLTPPRL